jgi:hypothetical protein
MKTKKTRLDSTLYEKNKQTGVTLDRPITYRITVPGALDKHWTDWIEGVSVSVDNEYTDYPISSLIGTHDQAALLSLIQRLYALGLPLISVICVDCEFDIE